MDEKLRQRLKNENMNEGMWHIKYIKIHNQKTLLEYRATIHCATRITVDSLFFGKRLQRLDGENPVPRFDTLADVLAGEHDGDPAQILPGSQALPSFVDLPDEHRDVANLRG